MHDQTLISRGWRGIGIVAVVAAIFATDLLIPLGIAIPIAYVAAILIAQSLHEKRIVLVTAILCSALVLVGLYYSPASAEVWKALANRLLALLMIGITAWFSLNLEKANQAKRLSEQRNRAIVDNAVDGMISIDAEGNVNSFNPAAVKVFGYSSEEVVGRNVKMLMPEPYHSEHDSYLGNYLRTGLKKVIGIGREVVARKKDGTIFPVELSVSEAQSDSGRIFIGTVRDITERKKAEEKLKASEERVRQLLDSMVTRVAEFTQLIGMVSKGDLSQRLQVNGDDDLSQLGRHLNVMTDGLARITSQIRDAANATVSSLGQLEKAVTMQSSGAAEQAVAVNETMTGLEEIKTISRQTVEKAGSLGAMAERTREEGERGVEAINQAKQGMLDIRAKVGTIAQTILGLREQTKHIGEITAMVNNVAEQSKLLALNASIEAAKAGEAGVGFAVVAVEIKELAEQSKQATAQVQRILQDIQCATDNAVMTTEEGAKEVDLGMQVVGKAGELMQRLRDVIEETTIAMDQIVAAVRQEGTGIEQIAMAMVDINKVTTQFVTATRQTKDSVENLVGINEQLKQSIRAYTV